MLPPHAPQGKAGALTASARRIYYSGGALYVDMYFYNRTRYAQTVPSPNPPAVFSS